MIPLPRGPLRAVVERHLSEAELLIELRGDALLAPDHVLDSLAAGPERRLRAHLDGLGLAGSLALEVVDARLEAAEIGEALAAAACLTVLAFGSYLDRARILELLAVNREGAVLGLTLSERAGLDEWLEAELEGADVGRLAGLLAAMAGRRRVPNRLVGLLEHPEPEILGAAATVARFASDPESAAAVAMLGNHEHPAVRAAAIETALIRRLPGAWSVALHWAFEAPICEFRRRALLWIAVLGSPEIHARLLGRLAAGGDRSELGDLLGAAGFCGRPAAIELALAHLGDPVLGPLAAELICAIAGLSSKDEGLWLERPRTEADDDLPPLELDDLDADLALQSDELLPIPDPQAFARWWAREGPRLRAHSGRLLDGRPWTVAGLLDRLRHGPLRRRHVWALELALRSGGRLDLDTHGWAHAQLDRLRSIVNPESLVFAGGLGPDS